MALIDHSQGSVLGGAHRDRGVLGTLIARIRAWQAARATAAELRRLSPSQLADIGIEPGDIDGFAERLARRRDF